ncbi:MAG: divergent PAP2 family protein [Oscillospiraceae bacterium]|nr:divergent PAP2 family protein [Oscillospiraceae bacterium]
MIIFRVMASNYIVNIGFVSWFSAQALKVLLTWFFTKKLDWERMVGAGGMPSSHSALVSSIAIAMANKRGFSSPEFGLALVLAAIVMYDAMGVRRAAGEQAKVLNRIVFEFTNWPFFLKPAQKTDDENAYETAGSPDGKAPEHDEPQPLLNKELKEFLGHTPLEVLGGCIVGILVAVFMPMV